MSILHLALDQFRVFPQAFDALCCRSERGVRHFVKKLVCALVMPLIVAVELMQSVEKNVMLSRMRDVDLSSVVERCVRKKRSNSRQIATRIEMLKKKSLQPLLTLLLLSSLVDNFEIQTRVYRAHPLQRRSYCQIVAASREALIIRCKKKA